MDRIILMYLFGLIWVCVLIEGGEATDCPDCGQCKGDVSCSIPSCTCPDGCRIYWLGDDCSTEIPPVPDPDGVSSWVESTSETSLVIAWHTLQTLLSQYTDHYGYLLTYRQQTGVNNVEKKGPLVRHNDQDILSGVLTGLEPNTDYIIAVWPYRTVDGQYDYGAAYDRIVGRTGGDIIHDGSAGDNGDHDVDDNVCTAVVPWVLFGISLIIIIALVIALVLLYIKYIRQKPKTPTRDNSNIWIKSSTDGVYDTVTPDMVQQDQHRSGDVTTGRTHTGLYDQTIVPMTSPDADTNYNNLTNRDPVYQNDNVNPYEKIQK